MDEMTNERAKQLYDVALWCTWPSLFPDYVGLVEAYGTYSAKVFLMEALGIEKVAHVAVRLVGHPRIDRWSKVYMPFNVEKRWRS